MGGVGLKLTGFINGERNKALESKKAWWLLHTKVYDRDFEKDDKLMTAQKSTFQNSFLNYWKRFYWSKFEDAWAGKCMEKNFFFFTEIIYNICPQTLHSLPGFSSFYKMAEFTAYLRHKIHFRCFCYFFPILRFRAITETFNLIICVLFITQLSKLTFIVFICAKNCVINLPGNAISCNFPRP